MLFQECGSKNAGVADYAEAFGIRAIGKAGKYLGQLFKKRCTSMQTEALLITGLKINITA